MANKAIYALTYGGDSHIFTLPYGVCSTAAATSAKTVSVQDSKFSLETGARVCVKFTNGNTASSPTLNVSSTGAKSIMYNGSAISSDMLVEKGIYEFIYDGTNWEIFGGINSMATNNAASFGMRGPVIITSSQTLDLTKYGLSVGDSINVVVIGGGGGGGGTDTSRKGGDAGKAGYSYSTGAGGGGGVGFGAGGGGASGNFSSSTYWSANGGGGSGYLASGTITLTSTSIPVTVGAGGTGAVKSGTYGTNGGTTSFGSYLSADGGSGGYSTSSSGSGGDGGAGAHPGGKGGKGHMSGSYCSDGGGGGGGWVVTNALIYSGTSGTDGAAASTEDNGPAGGSGGSGGSPGADGGVGSGAVIFWY